MTFQRSLWMQATWKGDTVTSPFTAIQASALLPASLSSEFVYNCIQLLQRFSYWSYIETDTCLLLLLLWRCQIAWLRFVCYCCCCWFSAKNCFVWGSLRRTLVALCPSSLKRACQQLPPSKVFSWFSLFTFLAVNSVWQQKCMWYGNNNSNNSSSKIEPLWVECRYLRSLINNILTMSHFVINQSLSLYKKKSSCHSSWFFHGVRVIIGIVFVVLYW